MTPQQKSALETLLGVAMTVAQEAEIGPLVDARNDAAVAAALGVGRTQFRTLMVTKRTLVALDEFGVLPRSAYALISVLKDAETTEPAWLSSVLTGAGIPVEDHPAIADRLATAWPALTSYTSEGGLDVGNSGVRFMLDLIAIAVPETASACVAIKNLAKVDAPISVYAVSEALNNG